MFKSFVYGVAVWLASVAVCAAEIQVQWFGHSTTRIVSETSKVILIDPFLKRNPTTPPEYRELEAIGSVDLILITHGHGDHVGDLLELVEQTGARVVGNFELIINMINLGLLEGDRAISMNKGGQIQPLGRDITIHMVPAEHSSSVDLQVLGLKEKHPLGQRFLAGGTPVGYVIVLENDFKIYHSGDTALFGDMELIGRLHDLDLALVCIGGHFTMGPEDAAYAVNEFLKPKRAMPIHYATFPLINRTPAEFRDALGESAVELLDVRPGDILKY
jgi:L-ascorbate metabolism protein UlaG (beta-lactamase superfamily)